MEDFRDWRGFCATESVVMVMKKIFFGIGRRSGLGAIDSASPISPV